MEAVAPGIDLSPETAARLRDPLQFVNFLWPDLRLYDKQWDILYSVEHNGETNVYSSNMAGKDKVAALVCLRAILCHREARVVTTSVRDDSINLLWAEIDQYINESSYPWDRSKTGVLDAEHGGPLIRKYHHIRMATEMGYSSKSYLIGTVSKKGEGLSGHHAEFTMLVVDEASGVDEKVKIFAEGWTNKLFVFGNPNECNNWWRRAYKEGNIPAGEGDLVQWWNGELVQRMHRYNIRVRAEDSPNVKLALEEIARGKKPSNTVILPGVIKYEDGLKGYVYRRKHWDKVRQCIGLDGSFYEGADSLLFPSEWLDRAERLADSLRGQRRIAKAMGLDPGQGISSTVWAVVDEFGLIVLVSMKTPDTSVIEGRTRALMHEYNVHPSRVCIDVGGGGNNIVSHLNTQNGIGGMQKPPSEWVRGVSFGESPALPPKHGSHTVKQRLTARGERAAYKNLRHQMYGDLRDLLDPSREDGRSFAIPAEYTELRRQMAPIPYWTDEEGRLFVPPKQRASDSKNESKVYLDKLIGCSPDEVDALVLAVHAMLHAPTQRLGGVLCTV